VELRYLLTMAIGKAFSLSENAAMPLADRIADHLFVLAGGREFYVPRVDRKRRNAAIREAFNGQNMEEVCSRYGVSKSQLYRIVG
jgi:Mor family transcriptional regulator